jgi:hypothetical protein
MFPERAYEIGAEGQAKVTRRRSTIEGALKLANAEPQLRGKHYLTKQARSAAGRRTRAERSASALGGPDHGRRRLPRPLAPTNSLIVGTSLRLRHRDQHR